MSTTLRGSANYIWFEADVLGQGATGAVYKARHKRSGELFAVKTFNHMGQMRPLNVQMREFQVLQKVNHENVVKLLAIEEESVSNSKVIIMELCTGGSLFNLLEDPRNSFGLPELEFFSVLKDVASGLKHLRELGVVHRDLKPGNIMLYKHEDGRHIYKLTDFGAARELDDEEQFVSLYGTEEYLYPDMYARAVLRRPMEKQFDASVDLWSLGVTLYHVATGHLPFRPFGGRSNKHTMYQMTGSKDPGVISGIQHEAGGPIEFSRELPKTCQLSRGAKHLVTPLLAGLMESKIDRMWTYDRFFDEARRMLKKRTIYVFNTCEGKLLHVFLDPEDKMVQFQEAIARQTDIPSSQQDLILDRGHLTDQITPMLEAKSYPETFPGDPLFLYHKAKSSGSWEFPPFQPPEIPKCPITSNQPLNCQTDYTQTKTTTGILYLIKDNMSRFHKDQRLVTQAAKVFLVLLCTNITRLQSYIHQFSTLLEETQKRISWIQVQHDRNVALVAKMADHEQISSRQLEEYRQHNEKFIREALRELNLIRQETDRENTRVTGFHKRVVQNQEIGSDHLTECICANTQKCEAKIEFLLDEMQVTVKSFHADKKKRSLSHNEEQIHKFERHKVRTSCERAIQILNSTCSIGTKRVFQKFAEWFKWSSDLFPELKQIDEKMADMTQRQAALSEKLDSGQSQHLKLVEEVLSGHREALVTTGVPHQTTSQGPYQATGGPHQPASSDFDFVMCNREDIPMAGAITNSSRPQINTTAGKSLQSFKGDLVSLKSDTEEIQNCLRENTGLLRDLQMLVDET